MDSCIGTGVEVVIALDPTPQGGRPTVSFTVDEELITTFAVPLNYAKLTQFNVTAFSKTDLPMGSYVLGLTNMNGTDPNLLWIDYFRIYDSSPSTQQQSSTVVTSAIIPASSVSQAIPTGDVSYLSETTPSLSLSNFLSSVIDPSSNPNTHPESSPFPSSPTSLELSMTHTLDHTPSDTATSQTNIALPTHSTTTQGRSSSRPHSVSTIGGAIGASIGLMLIVVFVTLWRRSRRRKGHTGSLCLPVVIYCADKTGSSCFG